MGKKILSPLVQAMNIFNEMDERDKLTLSDYIRSQTVRKVKDPKSPVPPAGRRSSGVVLCAVPNCGMPEGAPVHDASAAQSIDADYHVFHAEIKTKKANA